MTTATRPVTGVAELVRHLGDPADEESLLSHRRTAQLDADEEFPAEACAELDRLGVHRYYVPAAHGGALADFGELTDVVRAVAARDLTTAVAHAKTFLGTASVWVSGRVDQAAALAADVLAGARVSWALTERDHGSDLLRTGMTATSTEDGYRLDGEKWLINNATRGHLLCTLVRTRPDAGARGLSLLLVDKRTLPAGTFRCLAKVPTHGIRGADISGIVFDSAPLGPDAVVGEPGRGLDTVLLALQLTRTICPALSVGAAEHALSLASRFAAERRLYGRRLADLPHTRRTLGEAYAALFLVECVATIAARSVSGLVHELSVTSAVAKALVPAVVDELIARCGELLGARAFLSEVHEHGAFQKLERDHRIVSIFDGNAAVNQNALINQFGLLAAGWAAGTYDRAELAATADLAVPRGFPDLTRLSLVSSGGCSVVQSLPDARRTVAGLVETGAADARLLTLTDALLARCDDLHQEMRARPPGPRQVPAQSFRLAGRYEWCFAGAAVLQVWLHNRERAEAGPARELWIGARWLTAALALVLSRLDAPRGITGGGGGPEADVLFTAVQDLGPDAGASLLAGVR